jgi:hypothetical protein
MRDRAACNPNTLLCTASHQNRSTRCDSSDHGPPTAPPRTAVDRKEQMKVNRKEQMKCAPVVLGSTFVEG